MSEGVSHRVWLLRGLALGASLLISVTVAEVVLRFLGISYPILYEPHDVIGVAMRPYASGWMHQEGRAFVEANDIGFRGAVHPKQKPPGEYRIAFLGDSYTEAVQVAEHETFRELAETRLRACPTLAGREPVGLNFGISGIGTAQQYEILRRIAWSYDPDIVVLTFVGNDVPNNYPDFGGRAQKPFYLYSEDGELSLDDSFRSDPSFVARTTSRARSIRSATDHSRIIQLLIEMRNVWARMQVDRRQMTEKGELEKPPPDEKWSEAWQITEDLLASMAENVRAHGREFLLVVASNPHYVNPDPSVREARMRAVDSTNLNYASDRLAELATAKEIPFLDLNRPFAERAIAENVCLHGFENSVPCGGHWNQAGHRLAADLISDSICAQIAHAPR